MTRAEVQARARRFLKIRFRHQGRRATGLDCGGLIALVYEVADSDLSYPHSPIPGDVLRLVEATRAFRRKPINSIQPGDMIALGQAGMTLHLGIVTQTHGGLAVIHASASARKVVEQSIPPNSLYACYEFLGIED